MNWVSLSCKGLEHEKVSDSRHVAMPASCIGDVARSRSPIADINLRQTWRDGGFWHHDY